MGVWPDIGPAPAIIIMQNMSTALAPTARLAHNTVRAKTVRAKTVKVEPPATRNRAVDAYRAMAMCAVALGHWLAADVRLGTDGHLRGGNALDRVSGLHILTWAFQVMPLFFCIGGFSNAASLDAHARRGGTPAVWIRARLRRLSTPAAWLAGTGFTVATVGPIVGISQSLIRAAIGTAAIPLWFLGNYVADTALAPFTLLLYRRHGNRFLAVLTVLFVSLEATRFPKLHYLAQCNIVIGWLFFQMIGFAWKDGRLPAGRALIRVGIGAWVVAGALVAFGPWPLAMVSVPGAQFANTWPPSIALLAYGIGSCSFFIAAAPSVSRFLERSTRSWKVVIVANTMTMTSYLWHFTALAISAVVCQRLGILPTAAVGSTAWWVQKVPLLGIALVVLAVLVALLSPKERRGLFTGAEPTTAVGNVGTAVAAVSLAAGFELWTAASGDARFALPGIGLILAVHAFLTGSHTKFRVFHPSRSR